MKCLKKGSVFMDNIKNDNYFVGKIREDIDFIVKHTKNIGMV